ncbi:RidA family protein [Ammoniphilus sp. CFH 90114]|uniref:RidA family protein n=1 Tax=Ammoniphilus sp. CFH 90114 TaxID=2493665 RepID=UPI00100F0E16|nr:RidA family protein [Ammoniphilus sp. CFH 90114]RXT07968.1 RidA family protein [Ammoniphilus sp. CFH 90114]
MHSKHREIINPSTIHDPFGYTHVVIPKGKKIVYLSGQVAWDRDLQVIDIGDLAKQTDMVYQNIQHALNEVGATWDHIAKTTIYTTQPHEYAIIGAATAKFFGDAPPPAQTIIGVTGLALPEFLIEIEATVVMDE